MGCSLDLGGIGKGWAVDLACDELRIFPGYAIDAGGDIRVGGCRFNGLPWSIGVADPNLPERDLLVIELSQGAICTSSTIRRSWILGGTVRHHLIDPRTGEPSRSGVIAVTVIADSAVKAETAAKTALILGVEEGMQYVENQSRIQGLMVLENGSIIKSSRFPEAQFVA